MNGLYLLALAGFLGCAFLLAAFELDRFEQWQDEREVRDTLREAEEEKERRHFFAAPYDQEEEEDDDES